VKEDSGDEGGMIAAAAEATGNAKKRSLEEIEARARGTRLKPGEHSAVLAASGASAAPAEKYIKMKLTSSKFDMAPGMTVSAEGTRVSSRKGFRTARTNLAIPHGTYACEVHVEKLGKTGHARLGFGTYQSELQAPIGFDEFGFGYRDVDGSKVHKGVRSEYGEGYKEGDVIGMVLHLPKVEEGEKENREGGSIEQVAGGAASGQSGTNGGVAPKGGTSLPAPVKRKVVENSSIIFFKNGVCQGIAFRDFLDGGSVGYYPCASLYTMPEEEASVRFNFGETDLVHNYAEKLRQEANLLDVAKEVQPMSNHELKVVKIHR